MTKPGVKQQSSPLPLWIVAAETLSHSHETVPCKHWALRVFCLCFWHPILPRLWDIGSRSRLLQGHRGYFQTLESPTQRQKYVLCGDFSDRTVSPMFYADSGYTLQLIYLFGSPPSLHTWICWVNPSTEMKSRRVKWWLVLFREGYLWSHRPACLPPSRHRSTDSACGVSQHRVSRHPSFFNPPLLFPLLVGLMVVFFIL